MHCPVFKSPVKETYVSSEGLVRSELARRFRPTPEDIEDILQDATLKFTRYLLEGERWFRFIDRPSHCRSLLLAIAIQTAIDRWRETRTSERERRWLPIDEIQIPSGVEDPRHDPLAFFLLDERHRRLVEAIGAIRNEPARTVARLHFLEDRGVREIATRLGMNTNTVLSHIARTKVLIAGLVGCDLERGPVRAIPERARPNMRPRRIGAMG